MSSEPVCEGPQRMKKRFVMIVEVEIECHEEYGATEAANYIAGILNHLDAEDRLVDATAYELK